MKPKFKKRLSYNFPNERKKSSICMNCGEEGSHFVPPSLGEEGFFMCKPMSPKYAEVKDGRVKM